MPKTLNDIVQEWKQRALEHPDGWLLKDFIRTAIKEAFEATRVEETKHHLAEANMAQYETDEDKGWNDHAKAVKSAQDKFLGEEK